MGRSRDIADMLSNTEISNTANERLLNEASNVGVDSAYVDGVVGQPLSFLSTLDSLPITSLEAGQQAYVSSNNRLYISDGSGWYQKAFITLSPTITMDPTGIISLASDGTTTSTVTVVAVDSDTPGSGLTYSVDSDGNGIGKYVISQDSSVFTIRPLSSDSGATEGTFALTFSATDGDNIATDSSSFSLTFQSTGTLVRNASYINEGGSVEFTLPVSGYSNGDTIPYTITGISASDINEGLTGNMVVSGGGASKTITAVSDFTTEGNEYMTFSADNQSVNVQIADTSISNHVDLITNPGILYHSGIINSPNATYYHGSSLPGNYSGTDYSYISGRPKMIAVATISWRDTGTAGNDLNPNYGFRMQNGNYWTIYQDTGNAQTNMSAFAVAPIADVGGARPQITWYNGAPDKMAFTVSTFYSDNGIDLSTIKFERYRGTNGVSSLGNGTIKSNWSNHEIVAVAANTPNTGPNSFGVQGGYGLYSMSPYSRGKWNGSNGNEGVFNHGLADLGGSYLPSYGISHNYYPNAPDLYCLLLQKT